MESSTKISRLFMKAILNGEKDIILPKYLSITRIKKDTFKISILNKDSEELTTIAEVALRVGDSAYISDIDRCFDMKLST